MHPYNTTWFWAKLGTATWPAQYHPVICHLIDVGHVALALWQQVLRERVRRRVATCFGLKCEELGRWLAFWIGAHDIGKLTPCFQFQGKTDELKRRLNGSGFSTPTAGNIHHTKTGTQILAKEMTRGGDGWAYLPGDLAQKVAVTVGGHHGTFPTDWDDIVEPLGREGWGEARRELLNQLARLFGVTGLPAPKLSTSDDQSVWMYLAGLTSVADWIGSNAAFFPPFVTQECPLPSNFDMDGYFSKSAACAAEALQKLGWLDRAEPTGPVSFSQATGIGKPRELQTKIIPIAHEMATAHEPRLIIVEAPMGEGKTEAAWYVADCWDRCGGQGTYVALPTMATSNQMFDRAGKFLNGNDGKSNFMLLHGKAAMNDKFQELKYAAQTYDPDENTSGVVAEGWFAANKKHGLLAPFGVGTIDQSLLAVLQTKHVFVRLFGLAGKCVILDEVHAYDAYMTTLMERLLRWLAALGCPVVLLSATLPADKRLKLLRAYAGDDTAEPEQKPYPRVTSVTVAGKPCVTSFAAESARNKTILLDWVEDANLVGNLKRDLEADRCVAVIRNTVGLAQETFLKLKEAFGGTDVVVELFHARFPFGRRKQIEDGVLVTYGKGPDGRPENPQRSKKAKAILVATQVIEQSLDLDFDVMYSDVAPVDLVLQRAGRLHRHDRGDRGQPRLWLITPGEKEGRPDFGPYERRSNGGVYDKHILLRTSLVLNERSQITLPDDIDPLVEAVYRGEVPSGPASWGDALRTSNVIRLSEEKENRKAAGNFAIPEPIDEDDILQRFSRDLQDDDDPRIPDGRRAMTRLTQPSVQVILLYESPHGLTLDPKGEQPVDAQHKPSLQQISDILCNAVSLSHKLLVSIYERRDPPIGWATSGILRHHRIIRLLPNGVSAEGEFPLVYLLDLGIQFMRSGEILE